VDRKMVMSKRLQARSAHHLSLVPAPVLLASRYRIIKTLGQGMEAEVFLAEDVKLGGKLRTVKRYKESVGGMYTKERDLLVRLQHPFIPAIVDYIEPHEAAPAGCLVTAYVQGDTMMQKFLELGGEVSEQLVLYWSIQLCGILDYLHTAMPETVLHLDLKPGNMLLGASGHLHLIDFGISRLLGGGCTHGVGQPWSGPDQALDGVPEAPRLGTSGFAAPEQYGLEQPDVRTDLFGLGAFMYFMLNGGRLHEFVQSEETPKKRRPEKEISKETAHIVNKLLSYDRDGRFQTASETRRALEAAERLASSPWGRLRRHFNGLPLRKSY
jgi:eukaryotic-like serine/threonine-protein kinase